MRPLLAEEMRKRKPLSLQIQEQFAQAGLPLVQSSNPETSTYTARVNIIFWKGDQKTALKNPALILQKKDCIIASTGKSEEAALKNLRTEFEIYSAEQYLITGVLNTDGKYKLTAYKEKMLNDNVSQITKWTTFFFPLSEPENSPVRTFYRSDKMPRLVGA